MPNKTQSGLSGSWQTDRKVVSWDNFRRESQSGPDETHKAEPAVVLGEAQEGAEGD